LSPFPWVLRTGNYLNLSSEFNLRSYSQAIAFIGLSQRAISYTIGVIGHFDVPSRVVFHLNRRCDCLILSLDQFNNIGRIIGKSTDRAALYILLQQIVNIELFFSDSKNNVD
jgi:hypothetical protein